MLEPGASYTPTTNITVSAVWRETPLAGGHTVTLDMNGAVGFIFTDWNNSKRAQASKYDPVILPELNGGQGTPPPNYEFFDGWNIVKEWTGNNTKGNTYYYPPSDIILYADWIHVITMDAQVVGVDNNTGSNLIVQPNDSNGMTRFLKIDLSDTNTGYRLADFDVSGYGVTKGMTCIEDTTPGIYYLAVNVAEPQTVATVSTIRARTKILPNGNEKAWVFNGARCPVTFVKYEKISSAVLRLTFDKEILPFTVASLSSLITPLSGVLFQDTPVGSPVESGSITFTSIAPAPAYEWGVTPAIYDLTVSSVNEDGFLNLQVNSLNTLGYYKSGTGPGTNIPIGFEVNYEVDLR